MNDAMLDQVYVTKRINSEHNDLLHDVSFGFFGKRMATCSSDQNVKVWDVDENDEWHCTASWKTHGASVWKVTWAHPEFGQVLATCSFDRTAAIWEETVVENSASQVERVWVHKASLVDSRTSVKDVKFAPKHLGLQVGTCSANGVIRIYEAPDVMNLSQWSLQHQINCKISCCCLAWNTSTYRYHQPMIAVGSDDPTSTSGGKVFIYEYNDSTRDWVNILTLMSITEVVNDLSFAPNLGRKHHILAVASDDLHVFKLKPISNSGASTSGSTELSPDEVARFSDHSPTVINVCWNALGTVLLSSGEDGEVYLWMANYLGIWKKVGTIRKDPSPTFTDYKLSGVAADNSDKKQTESEPKNNRYTQSMMIR